MGVRAIESSRSREKPKRIKGFTVQIGVLLPGLGADATVATQVGKVGEVIEAEIDTDA
jgi:hypothetical protein